MSTGLSAFGQFYGELGQHALLPGCSAPCSRSISPSIPGISQMVGNMITRIWLALLAVAAHPARPAPPGPTGRARGQGFGRQCAAGDRAGGPGPGDHPRRAAQDAKGFKVELLYSVPQEEQGSWVSLAVDPKGRLIASDQYGKLYRVTPPPIGSRAEETRVEPIAVDIGEAHGLLWAFDSLYVVVNRAGKFPSGLYRVRDTDGDDRLDSGRELLRESDGQRRARPARRGPRARRQVALRGRRQRDQADRARRLAGPRGSGARTSLLPRMPDGRGFMRNEKAPGRLHLPRRSRRQELGARVDGLSQPLRHGVQPRRRPVHVRLRHGVGHEHCRGIARRGFARRSAAPTSAIATARASCRPYYPDSLPADGQRRPGLAHRASPSATGPKFPAKYQEALYLCDWSYGKLYAVHLKPDGRLVLGRRRGVHHRHAAAADRHRGQPAGRGDVLRHRRPEDHLGPLPGDLRRRPSPRPPSARADTRRGAEARAVRRASKRSTATADPEAVATAWPCLCRPRPLHPLRRPRGDRVPGPGLVARQGPGRDRHPGRSDGLLALARVSARPGDRGTRRRPTLR